MSSRSLLPASSCVAAWWLALASAAHPPRPLASHDGAVKNDKTLDSHDGDVGNDKNPNARDGDVKNDKTPNAHDGDVKGDAAMQPHDDSSLITSSHSHSFPLHAVLSAGWGRGMRATITSPLSPSCDHPSHPAPSAASALPEPHSCNS